MTAETWGLIPKSQEDNQTINEAINEAIAAHEADSDAHLGSGESLETHRSSEVIDHLADSVVNDKLPDNFFSQRVYFPNFQSLDVFDYTTGRVSMGFDCIRLTTNTTLNDRAYAYLKNSPYLSLDFSQDIVLIFSYDLRVFNTQEAYVGMGDWGEDFDEGFVGFKIVDGVLHGICAISSSGASTITEISGIDPTEKHDYRIEHYSGDHVDFYIDGVLVLTIDTNVPSSGELFNVFMSVKTTYATKVCYAFLLPFQIYVNE